MAADKLTVFNAALGWIGERHLSSLTENREPRRVLDTFWANTIRFCLEQRNWKWALVKAEIDASASVTPEFGFSNSFAKPTDWVRTSRVADNERMFPLLLEFTEEGGYWEADCDPLFVEYVSNSATKGLDLSEWSETFEEFVTLKLAARIAPRLTGSKSLAGELDSQAQAVLRRASSINNAGAPPQKQQPGSWVQSRRGGKRTPDPNREIP